MKEIFPDLQEQKLLEALRANDYSTEDAISELLGANGEGKVAYCLYNTGYFTLFVHK